MADKPLKFRQLARILRSFGVEWDARQGKGSHGVFFAYIGGGKVTYPIPRGGDLVQKCYVKECRRKFKLTEGDGVTDEEFYSAG